MVVFLSRRMRHHIGALRVCTGRLMKSLACFRSFEVISRMSPLVKRQAKRIRKEHEASKQNPAQGSHALADARHTRALGSTSFSSSRGRAFAEELLPSMPTARQRCAAASAQRCLHVVGGRSLARPSWRIASSRRGVKHLARGRRSRGGRRLTAPLQRALRRAMHRWSQMCSVASDSGPYSLKLHAHRTPSHTCPSVGVCHHGFAFLRRSAMFLCALGVWLYSASGGGLVEDAHLKAHHSGLCMHGFSQFPRA